MILVFAFITLVAPAFAAVCCGSLDRWDESADWALRQTFCRNPTGGNAVNERYEYRTTIQSHDTTYSMWGKDPMKKFTNC